MTGRTFTLAILLACAGCFDSDEVIEPDPMPEGETGEDVGEVPGEDLDLQLGHTPDAGPCNDEGCPCTAGECAKGLVCTLSEVCYACEPGVPGCPCDNGKCLVGSCREGVDGDVSWSICYPADLLPCGDRSCPGDAYCTDLGQCAWAD